MRTSTPTSSQVKWLPLLIAVAIGAIIWFIPAPAGLKVSAWHLFALFVATIIGLIIKPLPMGGVAIIALALTALLGVLPIDMTLSGFANATIWLIVIAFFISRGFIKTGLGRRVAFLFVKRFGKSTLGLSYSLLASDLILAPAMPSNTARAGGIIFPIVQSLSYAFGSRNDDGTEKKMGSFLMTVAFQGDLITSAMFMTSMAANPLAVTLAAQVAHVHITWLGWLAASVVPGLVSLILMPLIIYKLNPPEIKKTANAAKIADENLKEMGPLKASEWKMIGVFLLILVLWILGSTIKVDATTTALVGLSVLLLTQVLDVEDVKAEKGAWNTLIWFSALVMMATFLNQLGMIPWFSHLMQGTIKGMPWVTAVILLALIYFYSHYFFASSTAHVSAMYAAFLAVAVACGAPAMLTALILAFFSNLFGCTTHYGAGPAPIFFGAGYVSQGKWWTMGFIISIISILLWGIVGGVWWKLLGLW
ncbi:MAG: anion permease [Sporolactobacillus sp.]